MSSRMAPERKDVRPGLSNRPSAPRLAAGIIAAQGRSSPASPRVAANTSITNTSPAPRLAARLATAHAHFGSPLGDPTTPAPRLISPNVTPRSASRQSRTDSVHSTPSKPTDGATPTGRPFSAIGLVPTKAATGTELEAELEPGFFRAATSPLSNRNHERRGSSSSSIAAASHISSYSIQPSNVSHGPPRRTSPSRFVYASDAHAETSEPQSPPRGKAQQFFYANGEQESAKSQPVGPVANTAASNLADHAYVHTTEPASIPPASPDGSVTSGPFPFNFQASPATFFRSPSPPKDSFHLSYRKGASQIMRPKLPASPPAAAVPEDESLASLSPSSDHGAKSELSAQESGLGIHTAKQSNAWLPTDRLDSSAEVLSIRPPSGAPNGSSAHRSPESGGPSAHDLAANARRERKLLDLEISNTSLMAINRSLEREVRKQKLDLRRFRRLSRASTRYSSWLSEGTAATDESEENNHSLFDVPEDSDEDSEDLSDLDSADEDAMSPSALAESDERHRRSDARRLRLDLAKHKQLLVDSQKMNQSLKRCLGWTEQMIKDGNKALAYQIQPNELDMRGRVLSPEEVDAAAEEYFPGAEDGRVNEHVEAWKFDGHTSPQLQHAGSDINDRDSGVDVNFSLRLSDGSQRQRSERKDLAS